MVGPYLAAGPHRVRAPSSNVAPRRPPAINKPPGESSANVLRILQRHFDPSALFAPWMAARQQELAASAHGGRRPKKRTRRPQVKLGHGGTLDPLATGVLVVGMGQGTKELSRFLNCTKTYECVVLFGAATDSFDSAGVVVGRAPTAHLSRPGVEAALSKFRGRIAQRPNIFSALKVAGKPMYEYARAGGFVPALETRDVHVHHLELVDWLAPGTHSYAWPAREATTGDAAGAEKWMEARVPQESMDSAGAGNEAPGPDHVSPDDVGTQEKRQRSEAQDDAADAAPSTAKKRRVESDAAAAPADAPPVESDAPPVESDAPPVVSDAPPARAATPESPSTKPAEPLTSTGSAAGAANNAPPAARLRMTVSSGFYVRSLCHDLGLAVGSHALMSALVRTRQGSFELGKNVLEYSALDQGEAVWGPQLRALLEQPLDEEKKEKEKKEEEKEKENREEEEEEEEEKKEGSAPQTADDGQQTSQGASIQEER